MNNSDTKKRSLVPIIAAVAMAIIGLLIVQKHVHDSNEAVRKKLTKEKVWVLVAKKAAEKGVQLDPLALEYRPVARDEQPWSSITFEDPDASPEAMQRYKELVASLSVHRLTRPVAARCYYYDWTLIEFQRERPQGLSEMLPDGTRAVAVLVDKESVLAGLLQPRDHVDVLATYSSAMKISGGDPRRSRSDQVSKTVVALQDVLVVAVGTRTDRLASDKRVQASMSGTRVVLGLTPDRALLLSHVQKNARVSLLLRPRDSEKAGAYSSPSITSDDIEGLVTEIALPQE